MFVSEISPVDTISPSLVMVYIIFNNSFVFVKSNIFLKVKVLASLLISEETIRRGLWTFLNSIRPV